eukprot:652749-Rhodomonas_salina.3
MSVEKERWAAERGRVQQRETEAQRRCQVRVEQIMRRVVFSVSSCCLLLFRLWVWCRCWCGCGLFGVGVDGAVEDGRDDDGGGWCAARGRQLLSEEKQQLTQSLQGVIESLLQ